MTRSDDGPAPARLPDELRGWNWGAFLLNWIWGVGNDTYIAFLTCIPLFGGLVMPFVLGAKGNEWAWRNRRWDSIAHFKRVQRRWAIWGFVLVGATLCVLGTGFAVLYTAMTTSEAYRMGVAELQRSRAATDLLGTPIATGFPWGSISVSGASGEAALDFSATGPKASGRVALRAIKADGAWSLTDLQMRPDAGTEAVDLLKEDHAALGPRRPSRG